MNKRDCYVIDGCVDFIPVKRSALTQNGVEVTIVGSSTKEKVLVDKVYQMSKIFEPQKPVIPKFVADKIEYCKKTGEYGLFNAMNYCYRFKESSDWLECNQETFALAWLYGYEIEQEKLYTVEIPNPNLNAHTILQKTENGIVLIDVKYALYKGWEWRGWENSKLTEAEIKKDFEWAFQFAKPVEE